MMWLTAGRQPDAPSTHLYPCLDVDSRAGLLRHAWHSTISCRASSASRPALENTASMRCTWRALRGSLCKRRRGGTVARPGIVGVYTKGLAGITRE